jgi:hypothetical protein
MVGVIGPTVPGIPLAAILTGAGIVACIPIAFADRPLGVLQRTSAGRSEPEMPAGSWV